MQHRIATVLVILSLASAAEAQTPFPSRLTLEEAVARGIEASHRLEELRAVRAGAEAAVDGRLAERRPQVAIEGGYTRTSDVEEFGFLTPEGRLNVIFPNIPNNYRSRLDLQWLAYSGGRVQALARAARADLEAAGQDLAAAGDDLRLEITRAYWQTVTAAETARVVEESTKRMDAQLNEARSRFEAGLIPPNEVLSVEAQRARQQALLVEAQNGEAVARADLKRLIGLGEEAPLVLDASLDRVPAATSPVEALIEEARTARSERRALEQRVAASAGRRTAAGSGRLPSVIVAGGFDYARPNPRILPRRDRWDESWDVTVNARWTLWEGGRVKAQVAEAVAAEEAARARLAEFDSRLALDVRQRRLDLESARAALGAVNDAVRSASEARRVVSERFNAGVATSLDLLDAQLALLEAELDRTRALATVQLAAARLDRAIGK
jgi:outer membrane protein TolC